MDPSLTTVSYSVTITSVPSRSHLLSSCLHEWGCLMDLEQQTMTHTAVDSDALLSLKHTMMLFSDGQLTVTMKTTETFYIVLSFMWIATF